MKKAITNMTLYYREVVTYWLLSCAMAVAPKELELCIAKGLHKGLPPYGKVLDRRAQGGEVSR